MIAKLLIASALVATTVAIHAAGLGAGLSYALRSMERLEARFWQVTWLLIRVAWVAHCPPSVGDRGLGAVLLVA